MGHAVAMVTVPDRSPIRAGVTHSIRPSVQPRLSEVTRPEPPDEWVTCIGAVTPHAIGSVADFSRGASVAM